LGNGLSKSQVSREYDQILEFYFFVGAQVEYVFYNSLIQGNYIGKDSPHTEELEPWVFHYKYGLTMGGYVMDFTAAVNKYTRETTESVNHGYMSLELTIRF